VNECFNSDIYSCLLIYFAGWQVIALLVALYSEPVFILVHKLTQLLGPLTFEGGTGFSIKVKKTVNKYT
jgi:hypothetical protein